MTLRGSGQLDLELSEDDYLQTILDAARLYRWRFHHTRAALNRHGARSTPLQGDPGLPDLLLVRGGRLLALEVKRENGRATVEQERWLGELRRVPGVIAEVVRPSDWPQVLRLLQPPPAR
ncbi:MAG TPA: VRR-NUC domain-containing protein [Actinomycetes bacterium]|jgi:hypothetical protein